MEQPRSDWPAAVGSLQCSFRIPGPNHIPKARSLLVPSQSTGLRSSHFFLPSCGIRVAKDLIGFSNMAHPIHMTGHTAAPEP